MGNKASGMSDYYKPNYNSDEDLDDDTKKKIQDAGTNSAQADSIRQEAWQNAGAYPKLKRMVKSAWGGDTHN